MNGYDNRMIVLLVPQQKKVLANYWLAGGYYVSDYLKGSQQRSKLDLLRGPS